ncbi:MAG: bifunctional phosphoglucose/phosphomannose isomerase [bacterium]|nr:bifunctional phosphoglucose/phosphomannose isomerase [bacterium]
MNMLKRIKATDKHDMLQLLLNFPEQFKTAVEIGKSITHQLDPDKIHHLIFAGMGGSAIGGDLIVSCLAPQLNIPAMVNRNYRLPNFVNQKSLVVICSFSGNTEESLSCYEDAKSKNAHVLCVSSGGELKSRAERDGFPIIVVPGGMPPRCALAYLCIPALIFLTKTGFAELHPNDVSETQQLLEQKANAYAPDQSENQAIQIAQNLSNRLPIIYSCTDLLHVAAMRWKGQFSENAKVHAFFNVFPELNHNEIVGWEKLPDFLTRTQILYLKDREDHPRSKKRMAITGKILEKVTNPVIELETEGESRLARLFSMIYLGDMVSFYLAMLYNVDPTPVEKIQLLKDQLKKLPDELS